MSCLDAKVLKPNVTQSQVYDATAKNIVKGMLSDIYYVSNIIFCLQMFCPATMELSLHMVRHPVAKRTPWRVSSMIPGFKELSRGFYTSHLKV